MSRAVTRSLSPIGARALPGEHGSAPRHAAGAAAHPM